MKVEMTKGSMKDALTALAEFMKSNGKPKEKLTPLFLFKDHPKFEAIMEKHDAAHVELMERITAFENECKAKGKAFDEEARALGVAKWDEVKAYMKEAGLLPECYIKDDESGGDRYGLHHNDDGVMYLGDFEPEADSATPSTTKGH